MIFLTWNASGLKSTKARGANLASELVNTTEVFIRRIKLRMRPIPVPIASVVLSSSLKLSESRNADEE